MDDGDVIILLDSSPQAATSETVNETSSMKEPDYAEDAASAKTVTGTVSTEFSHVTREIKIDTKLEVDPAKVEPAEDRKTDWTVKIQGKSPLCESEGKNQCLNKLCRSKNGLKQATSSVVSFYERNIVDSRKYSVCKSCENSAEAYEQALVDILLKGQSLFEHNIERPSDLIDLDVEEEDLSSNETEDNCGSDYETFEVMDNVEKMIDDTFEKYNFGREIDNGIQMAKDKLKRMEEQQAVLDVFANQFQKGLDDLSRSLYSAFNPKITHLPPIDLNEETYPKPRKDYGSKKKIEQGLEAQRNQGSLHAKHLPKGRSSLDNVRIPNYGNRTSSGEAPDVEAIMTAKTTWDNKQKLPPVGNLARPEPALGDSVFVMTKTLRDTWKKGKLIGKEEQDGSFLYRVRIHENFKRLVSPKCIAYHEVSEVAIPHGTRIIAMYKDENDANVGYYAGIIAENLKHINNFRYLIFFDDGFAQYSLHSDVRVVVEQSPEVWNDLEVEARSFSRTYLQQYPERPMVKLQPGQVVKTEFNKKWYVARVQSVDASLALMAFQNCDSRVEWIYRGSTRLAPLYNELIQRPKAQQKLLSKPAKPVETPLAQSAGIAPPADHSIRSVAKKSTSKKPSQTYVDESIERSERLPSRFKVSSEHDGKVQTVSHFPLKMDVKFTRHQCGPACIKNNEYDPIADPSLVKMNLLLIPLKLGWVRKLVGIHLQSSRPKVPSDVIIYRAPCGRHLRGPEDVLRYLRVSHSQMPIDMFSFDVAVRTNVEFMPAKVLWEHADISYGKEPMPVLAVNSIDRTAPDYVAYSTIRIPSKGVKLNLDPNFLSCCSCKDDCQNRDKCECQQLTVKGVSVSERIHISNAGYQYRRLSEQIVTGVYECNPRCPCKKTCQNRVVQFPLRVRLQLFKTEKRGWGIRTLDDLPSGSFICIYAGQLLTDQEANVEGLAAGDEYFADLDFIEVAEKVKEGYESDVEISDEDFSVTELAETEPTKNSVDDPDSSANPDMRRSGRDRKKPSNEPVQPPAKKKRGRKGKKGKAAPPELEKPQYRIKCVPTRDLFGKDESPFTMDAKTVGNIGRYLNHSCNPNVFVQNVFVDTHDLRFPWVAFFANSYIAAGSELMWDYSYDVGSVVDKQLICHCGAENCRGRLL